MKPENVLLDEEGNIYLADFGLARHLEGNEQSYSFCGTPEYLAPEIIQKLGHGPAVDWWTLGCLLYEISIGTPPYQNENRNLLGKMILNESPLFPSESQKKKYHIQMSVQQEDLIRRVSISLSSSLQLLDKNPKTRLGSRDDMNEIKKHPYFKGIDFDKLMKKGYRSPYKPKAEVLTLKEDEVEKLLRKKDIHVIQGKLVKDT